jgi:tripartite-type tricarboxylate transporter receptor subunit TctC
MNVRSLIFAASAIAMVAIAGNTASQAYPSRPIRVVLPFAPGGSTDALARILAPRLGEVLAQPLIIDNRPGAGGNLAADIVAKSTPDGYTLLMASAMLTTNKSLYSKLSYDPEKDFAPVTHLGGGPYVLVAHPALPAKNVPELIALARSKPLHYASSGIGGASHLAGELLKMRTGIDMPHVPYKGGGPAALAVLAGETPILFGTIASSIGYIKAGRLKALAVSGLNRSSFLPEVPTVDESGVKGFNVTTWDSLVVPAATPKAVITRLNTDTVKVLRTPEVRDAIRNIGYEPTGTTPEEFAQFLRAETALLSKVIKDANIRAE